MVIPKPIKTTVGAKRILRKLNTASLKTLGSSLPPPDIKMNPNAITTIPIKRIL